MKKIFGLILIPILLIGCSNTPEVPPAEDAKANESAEVDFESLSPADQFTELNRQFSEAKVKGSADPIEFADRFWKIAQQDEDENMAFAALNWIATLVEDPSHRDRALQQLSEKFVDRQVLGRYCMRFANQPATESSVQFLEALIDRSPHEDVQAMALLALGTSLSKAPEKERDDDRVIALLRRVVDEFGDRTELKQMAEDTLFQFEHLSVGRIAPEIEGKDLDGESFKLSDYRGKVVMLDFWGNW